MVRGLALHQSTKMISELTQALPRTLLLQRRSTSRNSSIQSRQCSIQLPIQARMLRPGRSSIPSAALPERSKAGGRRWTIPSVCPVKRGGRSQGAASGALHTSQRHGPSPRHPPAIPPWRCGSLGLRLPCNPRPAVLTEGGPAGLPQTAPGKRESISSRKNVHVNPITCWHCRPYRSLIRPP